MTGVANRLLADRRKVWRTAQGTSRFASHLVLTVGTNILLAALGFLTGVLAARLLGAQGRGELAAIQLWPSFIGTIAMLGLPEALVYYSAKDPERAGRYTSSAVSLALVLSVPFVAAGYVLMPLLLSAQPEAVIETARWYLLLVFLYALVGTPYHVLRGRQHFFAWNVLRVLPNLGWLTVLVSAGVLRRAEPGWVAKAHLAGLAMLFLPVVLVVRSRVPGPYRPQIRDWPPLVRFGLPSAGSTLPQMLNYRLDQMVMAAFLPASTLGLYAVAVAWGNMAAPLLTAVGSVVFPRVAASSTREQQSRVLAQATRLTTLLALAISALLLAVTSWGLPWLFGQEFGKAVTAATILVVAGAFAGVNHVLEEGLRGLGRPTAVLQAELAGLCVTALALWLLLPRLSLMGAALASVAGYGTVNIVAVRSAVKSARTSSRVLLVPTRDDLRAVCGRLRHLRVLG